MWAPWFFACYFKEHCYKIIWIKLSSVAKCPELEENGISLPYLYSDKEGNQETFSSILCLVPSYDFTLLLFHTDNFLQWSLAFLINLTVINMDAVCNYLPKNMYPLYAISVCLDCVGTHLMKQYNRCVLHLSWTNWEFTKIFNKTIVLHWHCSRSRCKIIRGRKSRKAWREISLAWLAV